MLLAGLFCMVYGKINYTAAVRPDAAGGSEVYINSSDPAFWFMFAGIFLFLIGAVVLGSAIRHYRNRSMKAAGAAGTSQKVKRLALAALFAALSYIMFTFVRIDIPIPGGSTAFHPGNTFVVLAALLLGGPLGGIAGALGLTVADLSTVYVTSAPKTFLLKLLIGLICGFAAHRCFKITQIRDRKKLIAATIVSSASGLLFNAAADPLVGYFYKRYLFGIPQDAAAALAKIATLTSVVNAIVSTVLAVLIYLALRPALLRAGLMTFDGENRIDTGTVSGTKQEDSSDKKRSS